MRISLSYSIKDDRAERLARSLRGKFEIPYVHAIGAKEQNLQQNVGDVDYHILLWSSTSAATTRLTHELEFWLTAWSRNKLIIVNTDNSELPIGFKDLPQITYAKASSAGDVISAIKAEIKRIEGGEPSRRLKYAYLSGVVIVFLVASVCIYNYTTILEYATDLASHIYTFCSEKIAFLLSNKEYVAVFSSLFAFASYFFSKQVAYREARELVAGALLLVFILYEVSINLSSIYEFVFGISKYSLALFAATIGLLFILKTNVDTICSIKEEQSHDKRLAGKEVDVFVSYSHQDGRQVLRIVENISRAGFVVWVDQNISRRSGRYAGEIVNAIRTSKVVALMCSENSFRSDHVIREVYVAGDYKKPFVVCQLDKSEFPDDIIYFVTGFPRVSGEDVDGINLELKRLIHT